MLATQQWVAVFVSIFIVFLVKKLTSITRPPILNIYQQPGSFYWLKIAIVYCYLLYKKFNTPKTRWDELEKPQRLSTKKKPIDSVYFNGCDPKYNYFIVGLTRRGKGLADSFSFLKLEGVGVLRSPLLPTTSSLVELESDVAFEANGIKITPIEPMRRWRIIYEGKMKDNQDVLHDVSVDVEWSSNLPWFHFNTDMHIYTVAKAIAKEKWNENYFKTLELMYQSYYEQPGHMEGTASVDETKYTINYDSMRYHTFGYQRDWRNFHRYVIHFITVENGDQISVGIVSMPIAFSSLNVGYVYCAKYRKVYTIEACDFQLYQHGEKGIPPSEYAFSIKAGGHDYVIEVAESDSSEFYLSEAYEARVLEKLCKFTVNGIRGWGTTEWQYRNV